MNQRYFVDKKHGDFFTPVENVKEDIESKVRKTYGSKVLFVFPTACIMANLDNTFSILATWFRVDGSRMTWVSPEKYDSIEELNRVFRPYFA